MSGAGGVVTGLVTGARRVRDMQMRRSHMSRGDGRTLNVTTETWPPRVISPPTPSRFVTVQHLAVRKFQAFTHVY